MIKKSITFEDFDGNSVTEDHYFHLSKMELMNMELGTEGGMSDSLEKILAGGNAGKIIEAFKKIIALTYGTREGNTKFTKDKNVTDDFMNSPAFDAFFEELLTSPTAAADFINGVVPKDLAAQIDMDKIYAESGVQRGLPGLVDNILRPRPFTDVLLPDNIVSVPAGTPSTYWEENNASGLKFPRNNKNELLPWALRTPTKAELQSMHPDQLRDVMVRMSSGWKPPEEDKPSLP